jgi:hypothetical protein|tara:strand:+ start:886 stop:1134 length:249 start_codon:yes stop_codon:yes gene_type:complete
LGALGTFQERTQMKFEMNIEDYTIVLNALHYYKKVEKYPSFSQFDEKKINKLRDKLANQLVFPKDTAEDTYPEYKSQQYRYD